MKKKIVIVAGIIICAIGGLLFNNESIKGIPFPFEVTEITQIEMYHYDGVPAAEERKIITEKEDIQILYEDFRKIKLRSAKNEEPMTGGSATWFIFHLADNTVYEIKCFNDGVHQILNLPKENIKYVTSANIEKYWNQ